MNYFCLLVRQCCWYLSLDSNVTISHIRNQILLFFYAQHSVFLWKPLCCWMLLAPTSSFFCLDQNYLSLSSFFVSHLDWSSGQTCKRELIFLIFIAFIPPVWHVLMLQHDDVLMTASAHIFLMNISTGPGQLWNYTKHFNYTAMWREIRECALHFFDTVNIKYLWWWCKEVVMTTCQIWNWSSTVRC